METVTYFSTLMKFAWALGEARKSGDPERIKVAEINHDAYRDMCLKSDKMIIGNLP